MSTDDREDFLARWSRLKRRNPVVPASDVEPASAARPAAKGTDDATEPPFDITKLPKIEDLTSSSDIAAFLKKGVPEELKRLAMRRIWSLDPAIRDFIEVAENQYDWNAVGGVPGFGEIASGTDIQKLLQQAIGQIPDALPSELARDEAGTVADAATSRSTRSVDDYAAMQQSLDADSGQNEPDQSRTEGETEQTSHVPAEFPAAPITGAKSPTEHRARPRHGSALPSFAGDVQE
jgi:Protein of unknown function (DUF3306)